MVSLARRMASMMSEVYGLFAEEYSICSADGCVESGRGERRRDCEYVRRRGGGATFYVGGERLRPQYTRPRAQ